MPTSQDAVYAAALERFAKIVEEAEALDRQDPLAVALATSTPEGSPAVRMVLMRGWDERGFQFFTNATSRKGQELEANPRAALCFHWEELLRQVRIDGTVEPVSDAETDAYWVRRPRESRIGAWASQQSATLDDRQTLVERVEEYDRRFPDDDVPRPDFWRGYRVVPHRIEFWRGLAARLHERDAYEFVDGVWTHRLMYP